MQWKIYKESRDSYGVFMQGMFDQGISLGYYKVATEQMEINQGAGMDNCMLFQDDVIRVTQMFGDSIRFLRVGGSKYGVYWGWNEFCSAVESGELVRIHQNPLKKDFYDGRLKEILQDSLPNDVESFSFVVDDGWIVGINFKVAGKAYGDGRDVDYEGYDNVAIHLRGIDKFIYTLCEKCSNVMLQKELVTAAGYYD